MVSLSSAAVDVEAHALDDVRQAILTLADRQTAMLDATAAQGVRLDALTSAVRAVEEQVVTSNEHLARIASALDGKGEGKGGDFKELVDAVQGMAAKVEELGVGTATMANAVTLLARHLAPAED